MDRRGVLFAMGAAAVSASALPGISQEMPHHHMGGAKHQALIDAASNCSSAADICVGHCVEMLAGGDKTLAACAASSREVEVVCSGLRALAAQDSAHLASYAKVAAEVCKSCEAECRKHSQHPVCKSCGDACAACAIECGKVA
jgi:Cys-rich four helix bundle protein (predicted Tat secretion target)